MTAAIERPEFVLKVGGGLLATSGAFMRTVNAIARAARRHRILIVPGGGPFADQIREIDLQRPLPASEAHWRAILAMEQYGALLANHIPAARLVESPTQIARALAEGELPVLAPHQWLRGDDPLPHSWDVTGDSIAAWVAGELGVRHLVLIKPVAAPLADIVDAYFERALPAGVQTVALAATEVDALAALLDRLSLYGGELDPSSRSLHQQSRPLD